MIGYKNEYFEVIEFSGKNIKRRTNLWVCKCKCGKCIILETNVITKKRTKSCGCAKKGNNLGNINALKHGLTKHKGPHHPLYSMRNRILTRCYNSKHSDYPYYQGKGITVYEKWKNDAKEFYDWAINNGWKKGLTIDRINSDLSYCPENCRFVTIIENLKNMHSEKRAKAALAYAHNAPNPAGIKAAVHKKYPDMGKKSGKK